jgi:hypothetical protein
MIFQLHAKKDKKDFKQNSTAMKNHIYTDTYRHKRSSNKGTKVRHIHLFCSGSAYFP